MNTTFTRPRGQTLPLVLVSIGIVLVLVVVFALNYNQLMGTHTQAMSAIDSAAVAVAKDTSRIVVNCPLGRIALVDDTPASNPPTGGTADARPITGVNTLMATMRLDALIATQLTTKNAPNGNTTILYAISQDQAAARSACDLLRQTILNACTSSGTAADKYGLPINLQQDANNSYAANNVRLAGSASTTSPQLTLTPGYVDSTLAVSNVPVPTPIDQTLTAGPQYYTVSNGNKNYNAYLNIPVSGTSLNFQFVAIPQTPGVSLIESKHFVSYSSPPSGVDPKLPYTLVQVSYSQTVNQSASITVNNHTQPTNPTQAVVVKPTSMLVVSTAIVGAPLGVSPSGTLAINFASGGIPATSSPSNSPVDFTSPATIANAAMENASTGVCATDNTSRAPATAANDGAIWQEQSSSPGSWYVTNGPMPGGSIVPGSYRSAVFNGSQANTNPSVTLSFLIYDWLKSMQLRPNVGSVVEALQLSSLANGGFYGMENQILNNQSLPTDVPFASTSYVQNKLHLAESADSFIPPAYAQGSSGNQTGVTSALLNISANDATKDPRYMENLDMQTLYRQQANVWGYVPAASTINSLAMLVNMIDGQPTTVGGGPLSDLYALWGDMITSINAAQTTQKKTSAILYAGVKNACLADSSFVTNMTKWGNLQQQLSDPSADTVSIQAQMNTLQNAMNDTMKHITNKMLKKFPRLKASLVNSRYCINVADAMVKNMKALTAMGVKKVGNLHYQIAGSDYYPASTPATAQQLASTNPAPDGQVAAAPYGDWCAPLVGDKSQLDFYKHAGAPVIGAKYDGRSLLQPAFANAQSAQGTYDKMKFAFHVVGGTSFDTGPGTGVVHLTIGQSPFANEATINGQQIYQNLHALATSVVSNVNDLIQSSNPALNAIGPQTSSETETIWQVQARDEFANAFATNSVGFSSSNAEAAYFADVNTAGGPSPQNISNPGWCGMTEQAGSSTPTCPALVAEWQLTCPVPVTINNNVPYFPPGVTYQPSYQTSSLNNLTGTEWISCISYLNMNGWGSSTTATNAEQYGVANNLDEVGLYTNYYTSVPAYWTMDGFYFYQGTVPNAFWAGNGWSVSTSPYGTTTSYSWNTMLIDADAS